MSLPDLVDEAEIELSQHLQRPPSPSKKSSRLPAADRPSSRNGRVISPIGLGHPKASEGSTSGATSRTPSGTGMDPWTKDDWKSLERCFVQERKVVAQRMQLASSKDVNPSHVDVDLVLERFKSFLIASKQLKSGPEWDRWVFTLL